RQPRVRHDLLAQIDQVDPAEIVLGAFRAVMGYSCCGYRRCGEAEMARSSVLGEATHVEPTSDDRDRAAAISRAAAGVSQATLRLPDGEEIALPQSLVAVLIASAGQLSQGHGVTVLATEVRLSPAEVGELLGLSRPFVARLLDAGEIPSEHLPDSRHRVVRLVDVLEFQARRERRRTGRRRIADAVHAADLPY
ncbi:helix-turn-helix domain-containing protein, partial [Actinoplanes sp. GCM10030250]|uniref:helix-turn-helix domain-containing protein n=1 Tax=Actinoplanes sp. GCM10030250 TaxID=3273376 RepID=UPI0036099446